MLVSLGRAEPAEFVNTVRHQITGLFSPDRQQDLREAMMAIPEITLLKIDYDRSEATFKYDAAKVFPNAKQPGQAVKHFNDLLRRVSRTTFGVKPLCSVPREKLQRIEIAVVGLDCKGCSYAAYSAIYQLDGVEQATASFKDGLVTAWIHPDQTSRAKLEEALEARKVKLASE